MKRKSLREYSLNIPEQDYHDLPKWSYSIIARYAREGFPSLATLHDRFTPTPSMEFGSLFDSVMTRGKATLNEYAVLDMTVPDAERRALDYFSTQTSTPLDEIHPDEFMRLCDECGYQNRWGHKARFEHLAAYKKYYEVKCSGKKIVSADDWKDAMDMHAAFRNSEYLNGIFGTKDTDDIEYIYQAQFVTSFDLGDDKVDVKIMPDLLVVNHSVKTIQPVDLKTSSQPAYNFAESFIKYRYDIQAELYTDVIEKIISEDELYKDYTVLPYLFTDISRSDKVPVTYTYNPKNGLSYMKNDRLYIYKGWKVLLSEILIYEKNQAKVPEWISTDSSNDLMEILTRC